MYADLGAVHFSFSLFFPIPSLLQHLHHFIGSVILASGVRLSSPSSPTCGQHGNAADVRSGLAAGQTTQQEATTPVQPT